MERYTKRFKEDDSANETPEWFDNKVTGLIKTLRDENFGSEDQRKKMLDILTSLHSSTDKRGRLVFKKIGEYLTDIGTDLVKYGQDN